MKYLSQIILKLKLKLLVKRRSSHFKDEIKIGLDTLAFDPNEYTIDEKIDFANQGKFLSMLIYEKDWRIRCRVADQGYGLDVLVNDEHWLVRYRVAEQGYRLDVLINDKDSSVRREVARQRYGLDILINDPNDYVRIIAKAYKDGQKKRIIRKASI